jgi:hypothetical protein
MFGLLSTFTLGLVLGFLLGAGTMSLLMFNRLQNAGEERSVGTTSDQLGKVGDHVKMSH